MSEIIHDKILFRLKLFPIGLPGLILIGFIPVAVCEFTLWAVRRFERLYGLEQGRS